MALERHIADWFNSLPLRQMNTDGDKYERTCPCGASLWYEYQDIRLESWANIHYAHRDFNAAVKLPHVYIYDFSRVIIFTRRGFDAFKFQFGLSKIGSVQSGELADLPVYRTKDGAILAFYPDFRDKEPTDDCEGRYMTYNPHASGLARAKFSSTEDAA